MINYNKYREPTHHEKIQIGKFFEKQINKEIKLCNSLNTIFTIIGLFMMGSLTVKPENPFVGRVLGCISFVFVFISVFNKKRAVGELNAYKEGKYKVVNAHIIKSIEDPQKFNRANIWTRADVDGEETGFHIVFNQGDVSVGAPVILLYPDSKEIRNNTTKTFTSYMLSDECINNM